MPEWWTQLSRNRPATPEEVAAAEEALNIAFPRDYVAFVCSANGATGPIGDEGYIDLWPVTELGERNDSYEVQLHAPALVLFASDGGGTAYAFDRSRPGAVVETPFIGLGIEPPRVVAPSFDAFVRRYVRR